MKHRILIEFSADTLPDDFLDQIAGRVYGHPAVEKKECTATLIPEKWATFLHYPDCWDTAAYPDLKSAIHEALAFAGCSVCKEQS